MPAPTTRPAPPGRRSDSPSSPLARSSSARATTTPRVPSTLNSGATPVRRATRPPSGDHKDLSSQLKHETEKKENLLVKIQEKDQTIETLTAENSNLTTALQNAESRLNELYADQSRAETEMAQRIDVADKLRYQVKDLEKEKRDLQRRYNEQTAGFDAERQSFYDGEQHLKSRIQSLNQALQQAHEAAQPTVDALPDPEHDQVDKPSQQPIQPPKHDLNDPDNEPAEMTSLKLELSTLSTSYASIQSTLVLVQTQLVDLKRVNNELQEENESYMILLREKTLSGQFDVMKTVGTGSGSTDDSDDEDYPASNTDRGSLRSSSHRSTLDRVEEEDATPGTLDSELGRSGTLGDELGRTGTLSDELGFSGSLGDEFNRTGSLADEFGQTDLFTEPTSPRNANRKRAGSTARSLKGETLADLPISGPGLDLAAELGRAENKDILEGKTIEERDHSVVNEAKPSPVKGRKSRRVLGGDMPNGTVDEVDALKSEVKSLKDANKALSLYAAKIIDRIVAQEGFEHVLAVDYTEPPQTPVTPGPPKKPEPLLKSPILSAFTRPRPQSVMVGKTVSNPTPTTAAWPPPKLGPPPEKPANTTKPQRRSMSFDWRNFSLFTGAEKKPDPANLRPLSLRPGASVVTGARKLETTEDEDDRKERDRMNATMKLMGIQPAPQQTPSPIISSTPPPSVPQSPKTETPPSGTPSTNPNRRFSFFGRFTSPPEPTPPPTAQTLTQEALEHAEVENSLAALDNHERTLSEEIAKGGSGRYTEIAKKPGGRRSSRRNGSVTGSGSGSTVWSMGEEE